MSALVVVNAQTAHPRKRDAQCELRWQPTRALIASNERPAYVEDPAAVSTSEGLLLLGSPAFVWADQRAFDAPPNARASDTAAYYRRLLANHGLSGFTLRPSRMAQPVRLPAGASLRKPVALRDSEETVHLVWLGPPLESPEATENGTMWYARFRRGRWDTPQVIFKADRINSGDQRPFVLLRGANEAHVLISYRTGSTYGIAHLTGHNGRWAMASSEERGLPSQVTAQFIGRDSLAIAFAGVGAPGVRIRNGRHVYLLRIATTDTLWPKPQLVHWAAIDNVRWTTLYRTSSSVATADELALIWTKLRDARARTADTVFAMTSKDAGVTWTEPKALAVEFDIADLTQTQTGDGVVHLVMSSSPRADSLGRPVMHHVMLQHGMWGSVRAAPNGNPASAPRLSLVGRDSLLLVWGEGRAASAERPDAIAPVSRYALFARVCLATSPSTGR
jgi:hypothetical protein